jgi:hypothetical protein
MSEGKRPEIEWFTQGSEYCHPRERELAEYALKLERDLAMLVDANKRLREKMQQMQQKKPNGMQYCPACGWKRGEKR